MADPILNPTPPNLPLGPDKYERSFVDQQSSVLRLYFNQLKNALSLLLGPKGGQYIDMPYGAFQSQVTQTVVTINTPTLIGLEVTDFANGMSRKDNNSIHVEQTGIYNIQFSAQTTNADSQAKDAAIWLRVNGADLAYSNSVFSVVGTHGGQPGYGVVAANFFVRLKQNDYVEMWWSTNSLDVELNTLPPITSPFVTPGAPAVVMTLSFVSGMTT